MLLANFHPFVATEVIGCPYPTIDQALLLIAIDFCRETKAWTEIQEPIALVDDTFEYEMDAPTGALVQAVRDVWIGSRRLAPITVAGLQNVMPDWATMKASEPSYYNMAGELPLLRVYPTPTNTTGQALVVRATYVPKTNALSLPDFLGQRHMEGIASGAKARLMAMPGVPWSNPELSVYYRSLYDSAILNTRIEEAHDRVPGTIRVQPRSFGF
jgi:hypothetical protein